MQQIKNATTGNDYTAAATLEGVWNSPGGYYSITGGSAYMVLQYAPPGQGVGGLIWTNEVLVPVGNGNLTAGTTGVRFRDAGSVGGPAVVTAALSAEAEPLIIVGAPGSLTLAAGGTITGIIPAAGNTQTAGSGFTYTHTNGTGVYVFTLAAAFSAAPLVFVELLAAGAGGDAAATYVTGVTAGGFTVHVVTVAGGAGQDQPFNVSAQPVN